MLTFDQFILQEATTGPKSFKRAKINSVIPRQKKVGGMKSMGGMKPKFKKPPKAPKGGGFLNALAPPTKMKNPLMPTAGKKNKNPFLAKPKKPLVKKKNAMMPKGKMPGVSGIKRPKPLGTMLGQWAKKKLGI
jgi:hypothetical protein